MNPPNTGTDLTDQQKQQIIKTNACYAQAAAAAKPDWDKVKMDGYSWANLIAGAAVNILLRGQAVKNVGKGAAISTLVKNVLPMSVGGLKYRATLDACLQNATGVGLNPLPGGNP